MRIAALIALLALAACNTVEGIGEDISSGADTVGSWMGGEG
jgi:predicted small secreted protein